MTVLIKPNDYYLPVYGKVTGEMLKSIVSYGLIAGGLLVIQGNIFNLASLNKK